MSAAAEDSAQPSVLPKLNAAEAVIQLHAKKMKKVRAMMRTVYTDGESYVEHGRQMVALISVYAQELGDVQFPQLESAQDTLKQLAELQSKYFDIMRDFNQIFSRDGIKIMEELEARATASKADLRRVEKLYDSLEAGRKRLAKESAGSSKSKELKETVTATEKAIIETGGEVSDLFDGLNVDFCKFGAGFYASFHEGFAELLNSGKDLWDDTEEQSKKLATIAGKSGKGDEQSTDAATEGNGIEGNMGIALMELVDAERTQVTQLTHLERYNKKLTQESEEAKPCIEEDTVREMFKFTKEITAIHRAILDDIDFLGAPRKDLTPAEIEAAKAKPRKNIEPDKLLAYVYQVYNPRLAEMSELYAKYLEHLGLVQGTLEHAKKKKSFNSMLHKCQAQTVVYGMFKLGQLLSVVGKYFIGAHKLLQCVLDAGSEVDPVWMNYYTMLQNIGEMNKAFIRIREDSENVHTVMKIQDKINNLTRELADIGRAFICEDNFTCVHYMESASDGLALESGPKVSLEEDQSYHLFLFNDMLMVTQKPQGVKQASQFIIRENYNFVVSYPINKIVVLPVADTADYKNAFRLTIEDLGSIYWAASSDAAKNEWVEKIRSSVVSWCNQQVFGTSPEKLMERSGDYEDGVVPHVFQDAIDYVEKEGLDKEGIFRISGNARTMEMIRLKLNTGHKVTYDSPFNAAVMLKQWLGSLPQPIMQAHLYDSWHEAAEPKDTEECIAKLTEVVKKMPKLSKFILYMICDLCRKIVARTSENLMTYQNLSIVLAPSLMRLPGNQEFSSNSSRRIETLEKVLLLSDRIFPGVKEEIDEALMQADVYKEVRMKRQREAVDAIRTKHIREKSMMNSVTVSAQEWMKKRKEDLAAQEQREREEAEAREKKEREELLAKQIAEYEARVREEEEKRKAEEEAKARKEEMSREAEEKARKDFEEHEKKVREMAEKAEAAEAEAQEREKAKRLADRKSRLEAAEAKRKAAEAEAEAAAAAADEYDEDACAGCGKPVDDDDEDAFEALDRLWHSECFVCQHCKKNLADEDTKAKKGRPYCLDCYGDLFCPVCSGCDKPIIGAVVKALDTTWHKKCFVCAKCGKPITGDFSSTPDGKPLCC